MAIRLDADVLIRLRKEASRRNIGYQTLIIRSGQSEADGATAPNVILAQNWFEELKRLVPVN